MENATIFLHKKITVNDMSLVMVNVSNVMFILITVLLW